MKVSIYHELWNSGEYSYTLKKKKILGCFNPNLGQIWTNPNIELYILFKILTQL